jgi:hypothetical protein
MKAFAIKKKLIGLSLSEIREILGCEDEVGEQLGEKNTDRVLSLELQLWYKTDM